jgi:hypothetical protein
MLISYPIASRYIKGQHRVTTGPTTEPVNLDYIRVSLTKVLNKIVS